MKTLIIKEKEELFGLHQIPQGKTQNRKAPFKSVPSGKPLKDNPEICKSCPKNSLQRLPKKQIYRHLLLLKTELEAYIRSDAFEAGLSFGYFLNEYIRRQNKLDKQFALDMDVTHAAISQYLNDHRKPTKAFLVRLELHSNNLIPAIVWFKLVQKAKEHEIITDAEIRIAERSHVKSNLYLPEIIGELKVTCDNRLRKSKITLS